MLEIVCRVTYRSLSKEDGGGAEFMMDKLVGWEWRPAQGCDTAQEVTDSEGQDRPDASAQCKN